MEEFEHLSLSRTPSIGPVSLVLDSEGLAGEPWEGSGGTAGAVGVGATRGERKGGRGEGYASMDVNSS